MGLEGIDEEAGIESFDARKMPRDIKIAARREWHYFLWVRQYPLKAIEEITGFERTTIWRDLKYIMDHLADTPQNLEAVRQSALMSLRFAAAEIMDEARRAQGHVKSGLYKTAAGIHQTILARYTQPGKEITVSPPEEKKIQAVIDYMIEKMGQEALADFEEWWMARQRIEKKTSKADATS